MPVLRPNAGDYTVGQNKLINEVFDVGFRNRFLELWIPPPNLLDKDKMEKVTYKKGGVLREAWFPTDLFDS